MQKSKAENNRDQRFSNALNAAMARERGVHGKIRSSIGTQNEKLIHSTLKNYYAPHSGEQEIKLGKFFADAVSGDRIFEIQTSCLYKLNEKLKAFLDLSDMRVTVIHPVIREYKTLFINKDSGEVVRETPPRRIRTMLKVFEELYSIRGFLCHEDLTVILCELKAEKRVFFSGDTLPDIRAKSQRKKCVIEMVPQEILNEIILEKPQDYEIFLPSGLISEYPNGFTKRQLSKSANESASSLRIQVLRTVGIIEKTGKIGREFVYGIKERN